AIYILYYRSPPGHDGFAFGGSVRFLRLRYEHDDVPGEHADVQEISPELIVGYQWHPFHAGLQPGFYAQPWIALGAVLAKAGSAGAPDSSSSRQYARNSARSPGARLSRWNDLTSVLTSRNPTDCNRLPSLAPTNGSPPSPSW